MGWMVRALAAAGMWCAFAGAPAWAEPPLIKSDVGMARASDDARFALNWATATQDHAGMPFAIVDKREARLYVFDEYARLAGETAILLGQAVGDASAPEVGEHTQAGFVPVEERTTPAGRFISEPGQNLRGEHVVWVDYEAAFAIHRLRQGASFKSREARLASTNAEDKRASLGCVIVPPPFYEQVVQPVLGRARAVVYVLPETSPVQQAFNSL